MKIQELFQKDINRNIQGVVKIGQDTTDVVRDELDEYVVTGELLRYFRTFFENYRKGTSARTDKIGVWISGFFGSGKSHFLKILSYLVSGQTVDGKKAVSFFDGKIADPTVLADMKAAGDISADIILFNIDAKSDADSKSNKDAIVKVFMKVFNEMQGFCGSMPWIADLERKMTVEGTYEAFKTEFERISGSTWESAREDFYFESDSIIEALSATQKMSAEAARHWCETSESNYNLDIATFAKRVREYIEFKSSQTGKKHYVVFLCDEMGQYMGSDGNLLLNLQTVVENLGIECGGPSLGHRNRTGGYFLHRPKKARVGAMPFPRLLGDLIPDSLSPQPMWMRLLKSACLPKPKTVRTSYAFSIARRMPL